MADEDEQGGSWRAAERYRPLLEADASDWSEQAPARLAPPPPAAPAAAPIP